MYRDSQKDNCRFWLLATLAYFGATVSRDLMPRETKSCLACKPGNVSRANSFDCSKREEALLLIMSTSQG
jgi:ribulose bisphosphate carboxylase small subunit